MSAVNARSCLVLGVIACGVAASSCSKSTPHGCTPPRTYWNKPHNFVGLVPLRNDIALDRNGILYWNGKPISQQQLGSYLRISHTLNPEPEEILQTEMGVSCSELEAVRTQMDQNLDCRSSHRCGEGIPSVWKELPLPPNAAVS